MSNVIEQTRTQPTLPGVPSGRWQIDPAHSVVGFAVRHLMSRVRGTFAEFNGEITIADDRAGSAVRVEIAAGSVHTGNTFRDDHLRTGDFFDVEQHPVVIFVSTGLQQSDGCWTLAGELTLRGTTRPVRIELDYLGFDPDGLQGEPRIGFEGRTTIRRSDFGVNFGLVDDGKIVISDRIEIQLEIEAVLS